MPTMTETEERLRATFHAVASSVHQSEHDAVDAPSAVSPTAIPPTPVQLRRARRRRPLLVFAASFLAVLMVGAISMLTGGTELGGDLDQPVEPGTSFDTVPATTIPPPGEESSPSTRQLVEPSATAEFWAQTLAGWVDTVSRMDTFGPDTPVPEALVVESSEIGDPLGEGGSMAATVVTADGQMTVRAEYRGRGEAVDEVALQAEIAELTADGTTEYVDTIWHSPDADPESTDSAVQAEYFLTELGSASTRVTVLTAMGRLVVEVEATDASLLFNQDQQIGIASGMSGTSLDLTWNPDHPLSTEVEPLPEPTADDWIALDNDLWVATVIEGERDRLWVKTDIQEPTPAPSADTRSLYAYAGSDFVVIIIGDPVPEAITVNWDDGSNETVEPTWNTELDMGFARFDNNESQVLSVDGP